MLQAGRNIITAGDTLQKIGVEQLYHALRNPKPEIQNKLNQLRVVRNIDPKQYAVLKKQLPYFVCGIFNPNIRRTENFAYASYFILDIDHISDKGMSLDELRKVLEADSRVMLSFISPSQDGLKLLFRLQERCYDAGIFSLFYKLFLTDFSKQYSLDQVADTRTSDVTRACFISADTQAYFKPDADSVNLDAYIERDNAHALFGEKKSFEREEKQLEKEAKASQPEKTDVDSDVISQIKEILKNAPARKARPAPFIPEQLNEIMFDLQAYITQAGVVIQEIININYGKKIKCLIGKKMGEVNIFYGKRGFTVVQSPRTGTSAEINELIADLIDSYILTNMTS